MSIRPDNAKKGFPYKTGGGKQRFVNASGADVSKGYALVQAVTDNTNTYAITMTSGTYSSPALIAAEDVANGAEGEFYCGDAGIVGAIVSSAVTTGGARLAVCATSSAEGGAILVPVGTQNNYCGWANQTYQGATTLTEIVFRGDQPRNSSLYA